MRPMTMYRSGSLLHLASLTHQPAYGFAQLRTVALPVIDAVHRDAKFFFALCRLRIVETNSLDVTAIAGAPRVCDDDIVEGPLLCPTAGQPNYYHGRDFPCRKKEGRDFTSEVPVAATAFAVSRDDTPGRPGMMRV